MNLGLLSIGASAYGGLIVLSWIRGWVYIPATTAIIPSLVLAALGITTAALGLVVKGRAGFNGVGVLMIPGFFLGVFGLISWFEANNEQYHTADVCEYSKLPAGSGTHWACSQVPAANLIPWVMAVSLVIPAVLFLIAPYLSLRHRLHRTPENPPVISNDAQTATG